MIGFLARRNLVRHRTRTALTVLGLAVTTALLYDMALLAGGLRASLDRVLGEIGYELRVLPKGGLPFSSEAVLADGHQVAAALEAIPGVGDAVPLWGTTLYFLPRERGGVPVSAFTLGIDPARQTLYRLVAGALPAGGTSVPGIVLNRTLADSIGAGVGDTLFTAPRLAGPAGMPSRATRVVVTGVATFRLDLADQRTASLALEGLQRIAAAPGEDPASFVLGRLEPGAGGAAVVRAFRQDRPDVDVYAVDELLGAVRGELSYFQQFSLILGTVSLIVSFLLVLTLLTLAVNERQGEIAILRALGLPARRVVALVLAEGLALSVLAIGPGLALGALASGGLDAILTSSPGLPADLSFFVFTPAALLHTVGLVLVTGTLAGAIPALVAARTDVVRTLHQEVT